jgi:aminoglycoside/choline kinase family phosphotransferase
MELLKKLFFDWSGEIPETINPIRQAGSNRQYYRLINGEKSAIGVINNDKRENRAFINFTNHFNKKGVNVPEIYAVDEAEMCYLQKDLGDDNLFDKLIEHRKIRGSCSDEVLDLYKQSIKQLAYMQIIASQDLDYNYAYPSKIFGKRSMKYDLNYFKYYFVKTTGLDFSEQALQDDVELLTSELELAGAKYFMFRDFQARNIMIYNNKPYFIDFQGGRKGALQYDIASLLFQAKAALPETIRETLFNYYLNCIQQHISVDVPAFTAHYHGFVLIRVLQTLGAYGFRGMIEHKPHFIQSIPYAISNLSYLLHQTKILSNYPELKRIADQITNLKSFKTSPNQDTDKLRIHVNSFSYNKGIPIDLSGNGGGFVFDCRGLHNPGRYTEYKKLNGRDPSVKSFLVDSSTATDFTKKIFELVKPTIINYQERKFSNLMVSFGCTGGQHRSVFCADLFCELLNNISNLSIELWHREQEIKEMKQI